MLIALKLKGEADAAPLDGSAFLTGGWLNSAWIITLELYGLTLVLAWLCQTLQQNKVILKVRLLDRGEDSNVIMAFCFSLVLLFYLTWENVDRLLLSGLSQGHMSGRVINESTVQPSWEKYHQLSGRAVQLVYRCSCYWKITVQVKAIGTVSQRSITFNFKAIYLADAFQQNKPLFELLTANCFAKCSTFSAGTTSKRISCNHVDNEYLLYRMPFSQSDLII